MLSWCPFLCASHCRCLGLCGVAPVGNSPSMPFSRTRRTLPASVEVFEDVACDRCGAPLQPVFSPPDGEERAQTSLQLDSVLHLQLSGGYGEFVDLLDTSEEDDLHFLLCEGCAKVVVDLLPFLRSRVFSHVNGSVGHVCSDGSELWVGVSECPNDPDRHGWRRVYVVVPPEDRLTLEERRARDFKLPALAVFATREEADLFVSGAGEGVSVSEVLVSNLDTFLGPDGSPLVVPPPLPAV